MDKEHDILTKVIHNRLKDYEFQNIDSVWASIENDLIKSQKISRLPVKRIVILLAAAAAVAIFICLNLFLIDRKTKESPDFATSTIYSENQEVEENPEPIMDTLCEQNYSINVKKIETNISKKNAENDKKLQVAPDNSPEKINVETQTTQEEPKPQKKETDVMPDLFANEPVFNVDAKKKKRNKNLTLALALGNSSALSTKNAEKTDYFANTTMKNRYLNNDAVESQLSTSVTDIKYDIPISAGFFVRKYVTDSWALESGLTYTYLSSTETLSVNRQDFSGINSVKRDVKLHYLGLPLKVSYSFYDTGQISLYSTAGGMSELCIYGKESIGNESSRLNIPEIQWSVFASLGLNYKFVNRLGLFVEPGIVYYFDDGSKVNTIRKSVPFNVNLQAGLRLEY